MAIPTALGRPACPAATISAAIIGRHQAQWWVQETEDASNPPRAAAVNATRGSPRPHQAHPTEMAAAPALLPA